MVSFTLAAVLKRIKQLEAELQTCQRKLRLAQKQRCQAIVANKRLVHGLKKYLNEDQVKCLKKTTMKGTRWSKKTVIKALKVRLSCGTRGYDAVKALGQPLPSERTLQRHLERYKFAPGLLHEIMESLALKVCANICGALNIYTSYSDAHHCFYQPTYILSNVGQPHVTRGASCHLNDRRNPAHCRLFLRSLIWHSSRIPHHPSCRWVTSS